MDSNRIKKIQEETAHPNSVSVQQALLKVWNECEQEKVKTKMSKEELIEEILDIIHSENSGLSTHQRVSEIEKILNQNKDE